MYVQVGLWKLRSSYHFVEISAYFVLKIKLQFTMLSNFERETTLKNSAFWWVACLTHEFLWSVYSLIRNLSGFAWHMVWYIQYLCVWFNWVKQNRETDEEDDEDCVEEGFHLTRVKFDRDSEGDRKALEMGYWGINILDGSELELA